MTHRGADALIQRLRHNGVTDVFTVSGNAIMSAFDAALDAGIRLVHARHEASAVHMADARSRISGQVAVALVTAGPGHANTVSALYTAKMAEAPLVLFSGSAPSHEAGMGAFQEMAQAQMAREVTKACLTCRSVDAIEVDVTRAIRLAASGRPGPVCVNLPANVLDAVAPARPTKVAKPRSVPCDVPSLASMLAHVRRAARPLVLVGPSSLTRHGRTIVDAFRDATGVPVVGMESPRGIADPSLGAFGEMLALADSILLVGKRLDFTLEFGRSPAISPDAVFLQIDPDEAEFERSRRALGGRLVATLRMPANAALDAMTEHSAAGGRDRHAGWCDDVGAAIRYRPASWQEATGRIGRLHPVQALAPVQVLLDSHPSSVLVSDGGEFGQWAQACLQAPHRIINGTSGSIGSALPYALGARSALSLAPIVATLGDGTFGFHPAEIDTAFRYSLPFVCVVGNDARWNAEYQLQRRKYGEDRAIGCDLLPLRYDQVCIAFGGYGETVTSPSDMSLALHRASSCGLPACVNVMIEGAAAPKVSRHESARRAEGPLGKTARGYIVDK